LAGGIPGVLGDVPRSPGLLGFLVDLVEMNINLTTKSPGLPGMHQDSPGMHQDSQECIRTPRNS